MRAADDYACIRVMVVVMTLLTRPSVGPNSAGRQNPHQSETCSLFLAAWGQDRSVFFHILNFAFINITIGQGHFGKVYTAINNETGDIMAMKEIPLQPNDHKTLK